MLFVPARLLPAYSIPQQSMIQLIVGVIANPLMIHHHIRVASPSPLWGWKRRCGLIMIPASLIAMRMMRMTPRMSILTYTHIHILIRIVIRTITAIHTPTLIHTTTLTPTRNLIRILMDMCTPIMSSIPILTITPTTTPTDMDTEKIRRLKTVISPISRHAITRTS